MVEDTKVQITQHICQSRIFKHLKLLISSSFKSRTLLSRISTADLVLDGSSFSKEYKEQEIGWRYGWSGCREGVLQFLASILKLEFHHVFMVIDRRVKR